MKEIWKDIPGYEGYYQISNLGRVKSLNRIVIGGRGNVERSLKGGVMALNYKNNYALAHLNIRKTRKAFLVHRLVATAFIPNPYALPEVNHLDFDRRNNHQLNLEWVDRKGNRAHSKRHGRNLKPYTKLNPEAVRDIRKMELSLDQYAINYGVTAQAIGNAQIRKTWRDVL